MYCIIQVPVRKYYTTFISRVLLYYTGEVYIPRSLGSAGKLDVRSMENKLEWFLGRSPTAPGGQGRATSPREAPATVLLCARGAR